MTETLLDVAAELEARLDHPDDDLSLESDEAVATALALLTEQAEGLAPLREQGWTAEQVLGRLAASLNLVSEGCVLSASELLQQLQQRPQLLQDCLQSLDS